MTDSVWLPTMFSKLENRSQHLLTASPKKGKRRRRNGIIERSNNKTQSTITEEKEGKRDQNEGRGEGGGREVGVLPTTATYFFMHSRFLERRNGNKN